MQLTNKYSLDFYLKDGWYVVEVENAEWLVSEESGESTNTLRIQFRVTDGEYAGGHFSTFCPVDKAFGRRKLASILGYSRLAEEMEKKMGLEDLPLDRWAEKYLNPDTKIGRAVVNSAFLLLPGAVLGVELKQRTYKDRNGEEKTAQDIYSVGFASEVGAVEEEEVKPVVAKSKKSKVEDDEDDSW